MSPRSSLRISPHCSGSRDEPPRTDDNERGHLDTIDRTAIKRPDLWHVLLLNDDYTPREFVVMVLLQFFAVGEQDAANIMMTAHTKGRAVCGIFPRDVAETKVAQIMEFIKGYELPLRFDTERA